MNKSMIPTDARVIMLRVYKAKVVEVLLGRSDQLELDGMTTLVSNVLADYEQQVFERWETEAKVGKRWHFVGHGPIGNFKPEHTAYYLRREWLVETNTITGDSYRYNVADMLPYMKSK